MSKASKNLLLQVLKISYILSQITTRSGSGTTGGKLVAFFLVKRRWYECMFLLWASWRLTEVWKHCEFPKDAPFSSAAEWAGREPRYISRLTFKVYVELAPNSRTTHGHVRTRTRTSGLLGCGGCNQKSQDLRVAIFLGQNRVDRTFWKVKVVFIRSTRKYPLR